jgi:SAM-dependent methyltransferase
MKTRARLRSLVLDVTPPALLELARAVRARTPFAPRVVPPGVRPASWYDAAYAATDEYRRHYTESQYYFLWSVLADRMLHDPPASVLDLGCGPGQFAELLRDKGLPRYRGVDLSEPAIALARQRCPGYAFETADLVASSLLGQGGYDCLVALEFLEHVEPDLEILAKVPSGTRFYGTVPSFPYVSHVRHFDDAEAVRARYGHLFEPFRVDAFPANATGKVFYLLEGTRR